MNEPGSSKGIGRNQRSQQGQERVWDLRESRPEPGPLWVWALVWDIKGNRQEPRTPAGLSRKSETSEEVSRSSVGSGALELGTSEAVDWSQKPFQVQLQPRDFCRRGSRPGLQKQGKAGKLG